jgi:hypothetical protein
VETERCQMPYKANVKKKLIAQNARQPDKKAFRYFYKKSMPHTTE